MVLIRLARSRSTKDLETPDYYRFMKWTKKVLLFGSIGCLYPILWIILTFVLDFKFLSKPIDPRWQWEAKFDPQVPSEMMYLMFPSSPATATYDKANGKTVGVLDRAMTNAHPEISQPWIKLNRETATEWMRREDLIFDPPLQQGAALVEAASKAFALRRKDEWASIRLATNTTASAVEYTLTIRPDDDHVEDYVYSVSNGIAKPLKMRRYFGPGEALNSMDNLSLAALIAAGILALPPLIWGISVWKSRRRARAVGS
jgi:hypothetical protein